MPRMRTEVQHLEAQVQSGNKRFVRYAEGAALYSLGLHTFQEIAKEAIIKLINTSDIGLNSIQKEFITKNIGYFVDFILKKVNKDKT